jgi:hypothetical protein
MSNYTSQPVTTQLQPKKRTRTLAHRDRPPLIQRQVKTPQATQFLTAHHTNHSGPII